MVNLQLALAVFAVEVFLSGDSSLSIGAMVMALEANITPQGWFKHPFFGDTRKLAVLLGVLLAIAFRFICLTLLWLSTKLPQNVVNVLLIVCSCYLMIFVSGKHFRDHFQKKGEHSNGPTVKQSFALVLLSIVLLDIVSSMDNLFGIIGTSRDLPTDLIGMGGGMVFTLLFGSSLVLKWIDRYPSIKHAGFILLFPIAISMLLEGADGFVPPLSQLPIIPFLVGDTIKYASAGVVLLLVMLYELFVEKTEVERGLNGMIVWLQPMRAKESCIADGSFDKATGRLRLNFKAPPEGTVRNTGILVPANREESPHYCRILPLSHIERFVKRIFTKVAQTDADDGVDVVAYACSDKGGRKYVHFGEFKKGDIAHIDYKRIHAWGDSVVLTPGIAGALKLLSKPGVDFIDLVVRVTSVIEDQDNFLNFLDSAAIELSQGRFKIDGEPIPRFKIRIRFSGNANSVQMQAFDNYSKTLEYGFDLVDARPEVEPIELLHNEPLQSSNVPIGYGQILIDGRNYWPDDQQLMESIDFNVPPSTKRFIVVLKGKEYAVRIRR